MRGKTNPKLASYVSFSSVLFLVLHSHSYCSFLGFNIHLLPSPCAFINMVPVYTFILALPFGLENVYLKSKSGRAKVLGTSVCIGGALLLILYKGKPLINPQSQASIHSTNQASTRMRRSSANKSEKWVLGSVLLTAGSILWSSWFLIQAKISKRYPCQYSSTSILSFFGAIQSAILSLIITRNNAVWVLKGKFEILSIIYSGAVGSGLCYVGMSWCVKQKGPVFTAAFIPLIELFVAVFDFSILQEDIYLGSVLGSILVILGMYLLLWGKSKETEECAPKDSQTAQVGNQPVSQEVPITVTSRCP
ncbi:WAT1-related protein [Quillaja saponaria]|uniref:WAT1-related protein n=1 Tax=Quillaja saponaria TaxID=32244 RepID=A0AAD7LC57_QUISA|nr:WAT1-related protein [Quillaja saponaria]